MSKIEMKQEQRLCLKGSSGGDVLQLGGNSEQKKFVGRILRTAEERLKMPLSDRVKELHKIQPEYLMYVWGKPFSEFYNKQTNPNGLAVLTVAENTLSVDMLSKKMKEVPDITVDVCKYGNSQEMRESLAKMYENTFFKSRSVSPMNLVIGNGAGSVLSMALYAICNPGDGVIIPAPYYPGFDNDVMAIAQGKPVIALLNSAEDFKFDIAVIQQAYEKATNEGTKVKALLIASPNNPLGRVYTKDELISMLRWAVDKEIHLLMDEIYALSWFDAEHPFISISDLLLELGEEFGQYVHVIWSFSKDFDMSGFRVGAFYSENQELLTAMRDQAAFYLASNLAQYYLTYVISNESFVEHYITSNRNSLRHSHETLAKALIRNNIRFLPGNAGFFVMIDLRNYLPEQSAAAEMKFWRQLVDECKIVFTPGVAMHCAEFGWFRCCYAVYDAESVAMHIDRLGAYLREKFPNVQ